MPEIIFTLFQSFLSSDDYHYLLNSSKRLFQHVKRRTIYFHLTKEKSKEYLTDESFQSVLLSKVENGWNQIAVYYDKRTSPDIRLDLPIHTMIALDSEVPIELWANYQSLLANFPLTARSFPFPSLGNLKELDIRLHADASIDANIFSYLIKLTITSFTGDDITPLQHIPDLTLRKCHNIADFSSLRSQKRLQIHACEGLIDVRSFGRIHKLEIFSCACLEDVTPLSGIYNLTLYKCHKVKDISGLGGHNRFTLIHHSWYPLFGYHSLLNIPHVTLVYCDIKDVSVLRYAKSVYLSSCPNITDVSALGDVREVNIDSDKEIKGLELLGRVSNLTIFYQGARKEIINDELISSWQYVFRLQLSLFFSTQPNISSLSIFPKNIKHLTLSLDDRFADFINEGQGCSLNHLSSLSLEHLNRLERVEGLGDIPNLKFVNCNGIKSLKGLGRNHCVELVECSGLEDVSSLSTVPVVRIESCPSIDRTRLSLVPRLKVL